MGRYDRRYDYGMRGYPQTTRPFGRPRPPRMRYDRFVDAWYSPEQGEVPHPNRVTQRYNREYVDDRLNARRAYGWGGDRFDRTVEEDFYQRPYTTIGGTRTSRGARGGRRYVPGRFGPSYGGRFPDEL